MVQGLPSSQSMTPHAATGAAGSVVEVVAPTTVVLVVVVLIGVVVVGELAIVVLVVVLVVVVVGTVPPGLLTSVIESRTVPSTPIISSVSVSPSTPTRTTVCRASS